MKVIQTFANLAVFIFIASTSLASTTSFANPASNSEILKAIEVAPTVEQYQSAIQAFGVSPQNASVAAQVAANTQSENQEIDVDNLLSQLPSDFLEGSPY